jgi:DNA-binding MarR family transcriptional regulator
MFKLEDSLGRLTTLAQRSLVNRLAKNFARAGYDVTPEQWRVLVNLWAQDVLSQRELAERTAKDETGITRLVHGLERRGLVVRVADASDGRRKLVCLTRKGRQLQAGLLEQAELTLEQAQAGIDEQSLRICKEVLRQVAINLAAKPAAKLAAPLT